MSSPTNGINKSLVAVLALLCFLAAAVLRFFQTDQPAAAAACVRIGLVLGALWIALPVLGESGFWERMTPAIAAGMILLALFQKRFIVLLPLLVALGVLGFLLRPRPKRRSDPRRPPPG